MEADELDGGSGVGRFFGFSFAITYKRS